MKSGTEINQNQYRKLQREIAASELNVKSLKEETNKFGTTSEKAVESAGKNYEKLNGIANKLLTGVAAAGTGLVALSKSTEEYRTDISKLETNAKQANISVEATQQGLKDLTALTDESDSSIEALSNLMMAGFNENQMKQAIDDLSGAIIQFPDTLKIESLSDSLQETIATGAATGQFSELLGRAGQNVDKFNEGLKGCKTEIERQNYSLKALSDTGMSKVYKAYRESNKELIANKNATFELQKSSAKLGAVVQPIITKGTKELGKLAEVVVENKKDFVAGTAGVVAFAGVIKAIQIVNFIKGLEGATVAQKGLNLAMKANPAGIVAAGIAAVVTAMVAFSSKSKKATEEEKKAIEEHNKKIETMKKERDSWYDLTKARDEHIQDNLTEITDVQRLYGELQILVDENGKVLKGNEERVKFIINKVNPALDAEITLTGNQIQNYKETQVEITKMIELKKAQIVLESREADYKKALTDMGEKQRDQAKLDIEIKKDQAELDSLTSAKAYTQTKEGQKDIARLQKQLKEKQEAYSKNENMVNDYYRSIGEYQSLEVAISQKNYTKMNDLIRQYTWNFKTAGNANKQELEKQLQENTIIFDTIKIKYEEGVPYVTKKMVEDAKLLLDKSSQEFINAGGVIPQKVTEGVESTKSNFETYMQNEFKSAGNKIPSDIATGINANRKTIADTIKGITSVDLTEQGKKAGTSFINAYNNIMKKFAPANPNDRLGDNKTDLFNKYNPFIMTPKMATGGILHEGEAIVAEAGPEQLQLKNGKAYVTPLSSTSKNTPISGGNTYNLYFTNPNLTVQQIAAVEQLFEDKIGGAY